MKTTDKYTLFWDGPLSQWHPAEFTAFGTKYNCAEQCMMHRKAIKFRDLEIAAKIMATRFPNTQKRLGRQVRNFNKEAWERDARDIVYEANRNKFTQNESLMSVLIATAPTLIAEASPEDRIWGIGLSEDDPGSQDSRNWHGENWLGQVLTRLRDDIIHGTHHHARFWDVIPAW